MTQAAFQASAFQNNAFQVGDSGGGAGGKRKRVLPYSEPVQSLLRSYEEVVRLNPSSEIIAAIDPYISPESQEEWNRRVSAKFVVDKPPPSVRVNFHNLYASEISRNRLERILARLKLQQRKRDEEAFVMVLLLADF